ncbi:Aste57867_22238 [Aphanomyces stellatus]|uniref:Aste57867_22238 protein n=1 Tax=Aphanomyces stellatus TaxID=120398 RepID=A0A485LJM4_9STRA|nr:hypothetical protein As57867_022169 [Aphanomyces stellatus]VFT98905.1 Aste57867_22238 [Aphanomyces stellatus]
MPKCAELDALRDAVRALLEEDTNQNEETAPLRAGAACAAVESCLSHGLKRVSPHETVSLWGLLQWTNVSQLERHRVWKQEVEKRQAKEQSKDWYLDMFKEELEQISTLKVKADDATVAMGTSMDPLTPGFNTSIRIVNSLLHVTTPRGRVRAWIRHCCNTHLLSACLAAIMHPMNHAALGTYFTPGALCCDADMREIFVGLTSTLDRLQFGFVIDSPLLDDAKHASSPLAPLSSASSAPAVTPSPPPADNTTSLLHVLDAKTQWLHQLLKDTPPSILSPRAEDDDGAGLVLPARSVTLFGTSLATLITTPTTCDVALLDCKIGVPNVLEGCCRLVDAAAVTCTPALFASKIHRGRFAQLVAQVERTGTLSIWTNVHHSIIVLIKWLRDLPDPLFPPHLQPHCLAVVDMPGEALPIMELRNVVNQLHWSVKPTLARLCATLTRVNQSTNGATTSTLADIFGRILFARDSTDITAQTKLVGLLLTHASSILADVNAATHARQATLIQKLDAVNSIGVHLRTPFDPVVHASLWTSLQQHYPAVASPDALRGTGVLVFHCLVHFAHEHEELAHQLIAQRVPGRTTKQYPLPVAAVHIVRMLVELLHVDDAGGALIELDTPAWFVRCDAASTALPLQRPVAAAHALVAQGLWPLFDDAQTFYRLFGWSVLLFDRNYTRSGATCMDFNTILAETRVQVAAHLAKTPPSIPALYQLWAESLETQALAPKASAHMRTYVVTWAGGVTVRAYPSTQAEMVDVREQGEHLDTVLQAGHWLKLRDLPGRHGGGWVLTQSGETKLVARVDPTLAV